MDNENQKAKAIVLGGTGEVGKHLMRHLIESDDYEHIVSIGRRIAPESKFPASDKIDQIVIDMDEMESARNKFDGIDIAFCCLGTTRSDAGSDEAFIKVDHDYVLAFARLAFECGVRYFHVVSSIGSNPKSWFLYPRTKGLMERDCAEIGFKKLVIYKPAVLKRDQPRFGERIGSIFMSTIHTYEVGRSMGKFAFEIFSRDEESNPSVDIWENKNIKQYYKENFQ